MEKTILILGGGTGGVVAANVLAKVLPKGHLIALVDRNENHLHLASLPLVALGRRKPEQITRSLHRIEGPNVQFVQAEVEGLNPDEKTVLTNQGLLPYDSLIVALGAEHQGIPGQSFAFNPYNLQEAQSLFSRLRRFQQGHIVLFISNIPFTGAMAPYEIVLLLDSYFQKRGLRQRIQITLISPETRPLSFAEPEVSKELLEILKKRRIQVMTQQTVHSLSSKGSLLLERQEVKGDLFIGLPKHIGPPPLRDSLIAGQEGWLEVDPHSLATRLPDVYAVGDAVGIKTPTGAWIPKVGFFAHYQAEVVARNIALQYAQKKPRFSFIGDASGASVLIDIHRGCFVSLNSYSNPPTMSLSKPNPVASWTKTLFEKYWLTRWF